MDLDRPNYYYNNITMLILVVKPNGKQCMDLKISCNPFRMSYNNDTLAKYTLTGLTFNYACDTTFVKHNRL